MGDISLCVVVRHLISAWIMYSHELEVMNFIMDGIVKVGGKHSYKVRAIEKGTLLTYII